MCLHVFSSTLVFDDLSCFAFKRYVFFSILFYFLFFFCYSKAQLSTVADLPFSYRSRTPIRAHPRSRVSFDVRVGVCTPRACSYVCECVSVNAMLARVFDF